jgi:GAF domain-containing protein
LAATGLREKEENHLHSSMGELREKTKQTTALLTCVRAILEQRELGQAVRTILDMCKSLVGARSGYIALFNKERNDNEMLFLDLGDVPCQVDMNDPIPIRELKQQVYRSGKPIWVNHFQESGWARSLPEGHVIQNNVAFIPIKVRGNVIGLLGLGNKLGGFTEDDVNLSLAFTDLVAIAFQYDQALKQLNRSQRLETAGRIAGQVAHDTCHLHRADQETDTR